MRLTLFASFSEGGGKKDHQVCGKRRRRIMRCCHEILFFFLAEFNEKKRVKRWDEFIFGTENSPTFNRLWEANLLLL